MAAVDAEGESWPQVLAAGADFYMQPAWHPRSKWLAWVEWDHPQMPWDGTRLQLARFSGRSRGAPRLTEVAAYDAAQLDELHHEFDAVLPNHDGEDSDNWEAFPRPVGDARKALTAFVDLLEGRPAAGVEHWPADLLPD